MIKKIGLLVLLMSLFVSCTSTPLTLDEVDFGLKEVLQVDFSLLNSNVSTFSATYKYRCDNGIDFTVESSVHMGEHFNSYTDTKCDYAALVLKQRGFLEKIDAFELGGLRFVRDSDRLARVSLPLQKYAGTLAEIRIKEYNDVERALDLFFAFTDTVEPLPFNWDAFWKHFQGLGTDYFNGENHGDYARILFVIDHEELNDLQTPDETLLAQAFIPWGDTMNDRQELLEAILSIFARNSKEHHIDFSIPMEIMQREPPRRLNKFIVNGEQVTGFKEDLLPYFEYSRQNDNYESRALQYLNLLESDTKSNFGVLIEALGGTHSITTQRSEWTIDDNEWVAEFLYEYDEDTKEEISRRIVFTKNNEEFEISNTLNLSDYELLLDVTITWNNHEAVAYFTKK